MPSKPKIEPHHHKTLKFPEGFLWGAGNSAFQSEGNNTKSDWWEWEQKHQPEEKRSNKASDHYNLFKEDFKLAHDLGHNAHRLSLEWSRIEPNPGEFDQTQIDHYKEVLKTLKDQKMQVCLTLHHFSNPAWFAHQGGWTSAQAPAIFARFVKRIAPEFKDYVDLWITINEPSVYAWACHLEAIWPPQKKSNWLYLKTMWYMAQAHRQAYKAIHDAIPAAKVGIANHVFSFNALHNHSLREQLAVYFTDIMFNHGFYKLTRTSTHDFLGLNYYQNVQFSLMKGKWWPNTIDISVSKKDISDMGWEVYPEGLFKTVEDYSDYNLPIYITENGIATHNDDRRVRFLLSYLEELYHTIKLGTKVKGYFYWSLMDNMELHDGYDPKFGLIEIDFKTEKRTPRPSAYVYKEIIENNGIPHALLTLLGHGIQVEDIVKEDE